MTQSFTFVGTESTDTTVANLDLEGKATVPAGGATVELDCFSEFTTGVYIDPGATVTATKVSVKLSELASNVQLSDAAGVSTPVFTATMPAGAWRVRSGVTCWQSELQQQRRRAEGLLAVSTSGERRRDRWRGDR